MEQPNDQMVTITMDDNSTSPQSNPQETIPVQTEPVKTEQSTENVDNSNTVVVEGTEPLTDINQETLRATLLADNTDKPKHAGGRPCEFCQNKENILQITIDYIAQRKNLDKPRMPFIGELAILLDCDDETITLWAAKTKDEKLEHPEFSALIKKLKTIQHLRLQQRLLGRYNPTGSIMWLKTKFGYIETEKQIHAGDTSQPLRIEIVEDKHNVETN